jgi:uncharacterized protein
MPAPVVAFLVAIGTASRAIGNPPISTEPRAESSQGLAEAQYILGVMYANGEGVPQDDVTAHMWLNLSVAKGNLTALEARDRVAKRMTPAQIAEAQKLAREWKPK